MRELRSLIRHILEAAATSQTAGAGGLAMMRRPNSKGWNTYVLYDPKIVGQMLETGNIEAADIAKAVFGYIVIRPHEGECWNAGEVKLSAAQKGYGPLMYQAAMNDYAGGLFPDRGSTSQAARAVWQKYDARADVKKSKFDNKRDPKTPDPADDCDLARGHDPRRRRGVPQPGLRRPRRRRRPQRPDGCAPTLPRRHGHEEDEQVGRRDHH